MVEMCAKEFSFGGKKEFQKFRLNCGYTHSLTASNEKDSKTGKRS